MEIRTELRIDAGDRIEFIRNEKTGRYEMIPKTLSLKSLKWIVPKLGRTVTIREMNETIRTRGMRAGDRSRY